MTREPVDPAWAGEEPPEGYEPPTPPPNLPQYEPPEERDRERHD